MSSILGAVLLFGSYASALPVDSYVEWKSPVDSYVDWKSFHATGVNLGGWLVQEPAIDPQWWSKYGGTPSMDEWTFCKNLGDQCGPVLEERYSTYITTDFIDKLASTGATILRIPTTYAAWIKVPGSELYSGNQVDYLRHIATHAIEKYNMHVIIDMHSVPGGCNGLTIGEATGHENWWFNTTNLDLSFQAIEKIIDYIQESNSPAHYTLAPINEPQDNITGLFSPYALTDKGQDYLVNYYEGVVQRVAAVNSKIPVMVQIFPWDKPWFNRFDDDANIVLDMHHYYFEIPTVNYTNVASAFCSDAAADVQGKNFPLFFGEWSIQTGGNNSFAEREHALQAAQYAYNNFGHGSTMWTARFFGNLTVAGEGVQGDYWDYEEFMDLGYIKPVGTLDNSLC